MGPAIAACYLYTVGVIHTPFSFFYQSFQYRKGRFSNEKFRNFTFLKGHSQFLKITVKIFLC